MTKVGVLGAYGKMGSLICDTISSDPELELVAKVGKGDPLTILAQNGAEIVVDVTNATASTENLRWLALHNIHAVVGTSGISSEVLDHLQPAFQTADRACFIVPNFSIGAVLMIKFAEEAAAYFDDVEIIELHRETKKDAPSGTARYTAERIAAARAEPWIPDATEVQEPMGVRGGDVHGIQVHSVRLRGLLAHQEVLFGTTGETFTLRHDSMDRASFMPGVLKAVKSVTALPSGVTTGLDAVL